MQNPSKYIISTTTLLISIFTLLIISHFKLNPIANAASSYYWQDEKGKYCFFIDDNNNNIKCFTNYDSVDDKDRYCFHFDVESKDKNGQKKVEKDVIKCYVPNKDDAEAGDATELTEGEKCTDIQGANVQYLTTNEMLHSRADSLCGVSPVSTETKERGYQLAAAQDSPIKICAYETANNASTTYLIPFSPEDDGSYYLNAAVFGYPSYGLSAISPINDCPNTNAMYRLNNGTICGNGYDYELAVKNHAGDEEWMANWSVPSAVCDKDSVNLDGYIKEFNPQILVKSSKKFEQCEYYDPGDSAIPYIKMIANYENGKYTMMEITNENLNAVSYDKFQEMTDEEFSRLKGGCLPSVPILKSGSNAGNYTMYYLIGTRPPKYREVKNIYKLSGTETVPDNVVDATKQYIKIYCRAYGGGSIGKTTGIIINSELYVGLNSLAGECLGGYVDYVGKTGAKWDKSNYLKYFNSDVLTLKSCQNPCTDGVWADGQGIVEDGSAEPLIMINKWINSANKDRKLIQAFNMRLVMGGEEVIYLENALSPERAALFSTP